MGDRIVMIKRTSFWSICFAAPSNIIQWVILPAMLLITCYHSHAQNFYQAGVVQDIHIYFSANNWDEQLDTAKAGNDDYIFADSVTINGVRYDSVGVKYKGNSSYDASNLKNPLHIELDAYKEQSYQGYTDIKLSNGYGDPSHIREVLAYTIIRNYTDAPLSNFAKVYINEGYYGLFSNSESINKSFVSNHFGSSTGTFIKANPIINAGPSSKCNLKYISTDSSAYFNYYEMKSAIGWQDLVHLCDTITNYPTYLDNVIDIDRTIWMLALNNVLVNLDSYSGAFAQNYYLYKDVHQRFNPIMWDLNMSFGSFAFAGSPNNGTGSLNLVGMQQLSPTLHATHTDWPLITAILSQSTLKKKYLAHLRTITNEMFANGYYQTLATSLQQGIDSAVAADVNGFYTYSDFQGGLTVNKTSGSFTIPGINNLMQARVAYLQNTTEFKQTAPTISAVTSNSVSPTLFDTITITATINNANAVTLSYRTGTRELFTTINMFDDGAHGDYLAGDSIYGAKLVMTGAVLQYYLFAENTNAGMFSPERAEHEFYQLNIPGSTLQKGEVVINELLAINEESDADETGNYEDWIELYNTTNEAKSLYGLYLSDNLSAHTKYAFPANTIIPANGYLMIWADEKNSSNKYLHANFKLSGAGETIVLSKADGTILDSISYGQQSADISLGRCPNGTGSFAFIPTPTFKDANVFCVTGLNNPALSIQPRLYPNPANQILHVTATMTDAKTMVINNLLGQELLRTNINNEKAEVNVSHLREGIYLVYITNASNHIIGSNKLIIHH